MIKNKTKEEFRMDMDTEMNMEIQNKNRVVVLSDLKQFTFDLCDFSDYVDNGDGTTSWDFTKGFQKFEEIIEMVQESLNKDFPITTPKKLTAKKEYNRKGNKDEEFTYRMSLTQMEEVDLKDLIRGFKPLMSTFTFNIDFDKKVYVIKAIQESRDWKLFIEVKPAEDVPEDLHGYNLDSNVTRWCRQNFGDFAEWGRIHSLPTKQQEKNLTKKSQVNTSEDDLPI